MRSQIFVICASTIFLSNVSIAADHIPICYDNERNAIPIDNEEVISMEKNTPNQYLARAHIHGMLTKVYYSRNGHAHFQINFANNSSETIEVVYNLQFGGLPRLSPGMQVEACGDYITSNAPTDKYPASPDGSIIHWVHQNPSRRGHQDGFLVIDGLVYGQGFSHQGE